MIGRFELVLQHGSRGYFGIDVRGHAVDTTEILMAFVAAHALFNAMGAIPPPELRLLREDGLFMFPQ